MTGRHTRLIVLTVLAVAVVRTPSDALQETPTLQQITEMHIRADAGDAAAQMTLGGWYFAGSGMPQDTDEGVRWWRQAAEQGHLPSQTGLGGRYLNGRGVERDEAEAFRWYRMAAEQGDEEVLAFMHLSAEQGSMTAQVSLAEMYAEGRGVTQDAVVAARWYRWAAEQGSPQAVSEIRRMAEQGHAEAQLGLGVAYIVGRGVAQDASEAVRWYRLAAEQGHAEAQLGLGVAYSVGRGVVQDASEAVRWYRRAAEQGNVAAQVNLGVMYEGGRGVTEDKAEAMAWYRRAVEEGSEEAVTWIREVANQGWVESQLALAEMYADGRGVAQDAAEAVRWYRRAAEQGDVAVQVKLGGMYFAGRGVPQDAVEAMRWYRRAAEQGDAEATAWIQLNAEQGVATAQHGLGVMYADGRGVAQDAAEAVRWYRRAAAQGHVEAQLTLGSRYDTGRGVAQDLAEALRWYRLAAEQGHADAQFTLGSMYLDGRGVAQDTNEGERLYLLAAKQGSAEAQRALLAIYRSGHGVADDPFSTPIAMGHRAIEVDIVEFATIPNSEGLAARMNLLIDEPGTRRLFVNDMRGPLYSVSYDGSTVTQYLNINDRVWGISVIWTWSEQGFQSFAFHPQFNDSGAPGFGKFYTLTDTADTGPPADFTSGGDLNSHDTVLLEWTAEDPWALTYDGGPPRELIRYEQPVGNHNGGHLAFNPTSSPGDADFGLLYMGAADGGDGGDPLNLAQSRRSAFGKILRLDPLGSNSSNGQYGIPADNPFANDDISDTLGEIYALGLRNPQRFNWDSATGNMLVADIGQESVEEISLVTAGANLGWNDWEGSFRFFGTQGVVSLANPRGEARMTYPVVEYGQRDPLLQPASAVTGVYVYRATAIPQLVNLVLFGDNPSGEMFAFSADDLPAGGQEAIRRILFNNSDGPKTLLQLIQEKNTLEGQVVATRADMRLGLGPNDQIFVLNKHDGIIRLLTAER